MALEKILILDQIFALKIPNKLIQHTGFTIKLLTSLLCLWQIKHSLTVSWRLAQY